MKLISLLTKPLNLLRAFFAIMVLIVFFMVETVFLIIYFLVETPLRFILDKLEEIIRVTIKFIK